ncbi:ATP-binding protein [Symbiobacterium terraclitae]|uniref:ATP-binding protein n=1 Tax=Symbiobacterium terraclitae TaxID=557451 RepID=UPI0035B53AB9
MEERRNLGLQWRLVAVTLAAGVLSSGLAVFGFWGAGEYGLGREDALLVGAIAGLAGGLVASVWSFWLARRIKYRLWKAGDLALRIRRGDLSARLPVGDDDEIGELERQLNQMAAYLEQAVGDLSRMAEQNRLLAEEAGRGAALEERARLARDLHDTVNQQLFVLSLRAAAVRKRVSRELSRDGAGQTVGDGPRPPGDGAVPAVGDGPRPPGDGVVPTAGDGPRPTGGGAGQTAGDGARPSGDGVVPTAGDGPSSPGGGVVPTAGDGPRPTGGGAGQTTGNGIRPTSDGTVSTAGDGPRPTGDGTVPAAGDGASPADGSGAATAAGSGGSAPTPGGVLLSWLASLPDELAALEELARAAHSQTRELILQLRPTTLEQQGLGPALAEYVRTAATREGWEVETEIDPALRLRGPEGEALFRVAQEALNNAAKHARASRIRVALQRLGGEIRLRVADDGVGFDRSSGIRPTAVGLVGMRERMAALGGRIQVRTAPGKGTEITAILPAPHPAEPGEAGSRRAEPAEQRSEPVGGARSEERAEHEAGHPGGVAG